MVDYFNSLKLNCTVYGGGCYFKRFGSFCIYDYIILF